MSAQPDATRVAFPACSRTSTSPLVRGTLPTIAPLPDLREHFPRIHPRVDHLASLAEPTPFVWVVHVDSEPIRVGFSVLVKKVADRLSTSELVGDVGGIG